MAFKQDIHGFIKSSKKGKKIHIVRTKTLGTKYAFLYFEHQDICVVIQSGLDINITQRRGQMWSFYQVGLYVMWAR